MGREWTDEQLKAITERGRNILVSAGAGSGKTAVMVERVVRLIMEGRVPVSAMLIVTFTKAAASEMKERLRKALKDRLTEISKSAAGGDNTGSGDSGKATHAGDTNGGITGTGSNADEMAWIREQLDALHSAQISTFHSFAQRVLKEFFYFTDIEPGFRVLDDAEAEVLKEQAMEELLDSEYEAAELTGKGAEEGNSDFIAFLDAYSSEKNDNNARELISMLYRKLEAVPDRFDVLEEKAAELAGDIEQFRKTETYGKLAQYIAVQLERAQASVECAGKILIDNGLGRMADLVAEDGEQLGMARDAAAKGDAERAVEMLRTITFSTLRPRKDEKELYSDDVKSMAGAHRDAYKGIVKSILKICYADLDHMIGIMHMTQGYAETLVRLEKRFDEIYSGIKRDSNAIDYSDMEHYALEILKHEEARQYYRETFRYIFIDEYQDTNIMQETIIGMIRRDDNLFMVGDIKQSIYHFRLADPDIFKAKYEDYAEEGKKGESAKSVKIDLNRNFRSRSHVLDEINKMFRPIMEGYDENAELKPGTGDGPLLLDPPETHIVDTAALDEDNVDEEILDMQTEELEAAEAVRIIKHNIGREYTGSDDKPKKLKYSDIVILMRSFRRSAEGYRKVFRAAGIPLYIDDESGYFDSIEINVFMSLLSVIDNKRQDVPFIALLRSEIFGFSCRELALIRKMHRKGSFVDAAEAAAEDPDVPEDLRDKCAEVFTKIRTWQAYSKTLPLSDLIWRLMNETGYYITAGAMPNGAVRQANLRLLSDRARDYAERSLGSLYGFIQYIEQVKKNKVEMPQAALLSENENVVRIMTIHHSKGLEFPLVIVSGMNKTHGSSGVPGISFDREEGLGLRAVDPENHLYEDGLILRMTHAKDKSDEADEMKRVFYVAVTRAQETFYLLGAAEFDKMMERLDAQVSSDSSLLRMSRYLPGIVRVDPSELSDFAEEEVEQEADMDAAEITRGQAEAVSRLDYEYPYASSSVLAAKTSVTGLNKASMESSRKLNSVEADDDISLRKIQDEEEASEERGAVKGSGAGAEEAAWNRAGAAGDAEGGAGSMQDDTAPDFVRGSKGITSAERGTAYHGVMERIDFIRAASEGVPYIKEQMGSYVDAGIFTADEMSSVDPRTISRFFDSDLGKRAVAAAEVGALYREQTFESKVKINNEDVLVQGVIDIYFEEPDGIVLADYKTNYIDNTKDREEEYERIISMYRTQLSIYADSIEDAVGKRVKEKYLYLFSADREVKVR